MPAKGRPSKFKKRYINDIIDFFSVEPYVKEVMESSVEYYKDGELKKKSEKSRLIPNKLPTLFGFAKSVGVAYKTVWSWAFEKEESKLSEDLRNFRNAYNEAKELQKEFLISIGLSGAANAPFAIFTAKNVTDMRDKTEIDHTSKGERIEGFNYVKPDDADNKTTS